jgi:hypothetical protein
VQRLPAEKDVEGGLASEDRFQLLLQFQRRGQPVFRAPFAALHAVALPCDSFAEVGGSWPISWDRPLDRQDDLNRDRAEHVPGIRVVQALEKHQVLWAIVSAPVKELRKALLRYQRGNDAVLSP